MIPSALSSMWTGIAYLSVVWNGSCVNVESLGGYDVLCVACIGALPCVRIADQFAYVTQAL